MKTYQGRPISALQELRIKDLRRAANSLKRLYPSKITYRLQSYKDIPRFRIEDMYKTDEDLIKSPISTVNPPRSRPSTALPKPIRPDVTLELRSETFDKDMIISSFAVTHAKNPNTNHNNEVIVARGSLIRKKLRATVITRGVSGISVTSSLTSPGRLPNRYSVSKPVVSVPSIYH